MCWEQTSGRGEQKQSWRVQGMLREQQVHRGDWEQSSRNNRQQPKYRGHWVPLRLWLLPEAIVMDGLCNECNTARCVLRACDRGHTIYRVSSEMYWWPSTWQRPQPVWCVSWHRGKGKRKSRMERREQTDDFKEDSVKCVDWRAPPPDLPSTSARMEPLLRGVEWLLMVLPLQTLEPPWWDEWRNKWLQLSSYFICCWV